MSKIKILRILNNYFSEDRELFLSLKNILGFYPRDIELYKQALMHKSIMHRNEKGKPVNNERLEFLGDAVLDAVVGDIVYQRFPGKREGFLTNARSKIVQRETLGKLANNMGITKLVLSSGRSQSHNSYLGGNAFEALVGAIYLDYGYKKCMQFMQKQICDKQLNVEKTAFKEVNFKSKLLEWTQKNRIHLEYVLVEQGVKDSSPVFVYKAILENIEGGTGSGFSKKEAQQEASKLTLDRLRKDKKYLDSIFAAKSERTKMEETPFMSVPNISTKSELDAIIVQTDDSKKEQPKPKCKEIPIRQGKKSEQSTSVDNEEEYTDFNLDDIKMKNLSREEIIAAAEAEAFRSPL